MKGIRFRDFEESDYADVVELWRRTGLYDKRRGDDLKAIERTIEKGGRLILMLDGERIIGSSWLTTDGRRTFIQYFAIDPEYQGRGLSHLLLEESLKFAREIGLQVKLEVHRENLVARRLYEKWGFRPLGDYEVYILRDLGDGKS